LAAVSIGGLIAAAVTAALAAATGHWVSTAAGAVAALALITYLRARRAMRRTRRSLTLLASLGLSVRG
jgi:membrane protein YdbS with pleckstrin-like domain